VTADGFLELAAPLPEPTLLVSGEGVVLAANPAAARLARLPARELAGRRLDALVADEPDRIARYLRACSRTGEMLMGAFRFRTGEAVVRCRCDGAAVRPRSADAPALILLRVRPNEQEATSGRSVELNHRIALLAREIAERRRAEAELHVQRESLRVTLASIGDGVIATDPEGRVTFMNPVAEALTGWSRDDALGMPLERVFRIVHEETRQPAENPVERVLRDGQVVGLANHTALIAKDGREHPIDDSAAPIRDDEGRIQGVVMVFHDIADRRHAEQALFRLAAIVESSEDAIVGKTPTGIVTSWNPAAERIFGWPAGEVVGRSITVIVPADRLEEEAEFLRRLARGERIDHYETVRVRKDGRRIDVSVSLSPVRDSRGRIIGASKIARDITERTRAEAERASLLRREQAARQEAEVASRLKDEFLATLSHELRTPMNAIFGWARMLRTGAVGPDRVDRALEAIERNSRVQIQLIADLLDVSRIITGRIRLTIRPLDLAPVIGAAVDSVRPSALAKGVKLESVCAPDAGPVTGDPDRLQQVFWNLLINAIKFTPRGGHVEIRLERAASKVLVTVTDTGVGINPELLSHVFERFRQGDSSITRAYGGLGLGLAIVRHLVELHGGSVRAESRGEGQGARFTVSLPIAAVLSTASPSAAARPASEPATAAESLPRLDDVRVLVVDDEADARGLIGEVLRRCGAAVVPVASAASALDALRRAPVDVLIADIWMPEEDGYELIRKVRAAERETGAPAVPAMALTAYARAEDRQRALAAGFQEHLTKPADPIALARAVAALLARD
jgi:PAS domain S-box-containing protein